jgi:tight adherence protein C
MTLALSTRLSPGALLLAALVLLLLLAFLIVLAWAPLRRDHRLQRQLAQIRDTYGPTGAGGSGLEAPASLMRAVAAIGSLLTRSGLLSPKAIANLESTLASAGFRGGRALPVFVGAKMLLLAGLPLLTAFVLRDTSFSSNMYRVLLVTCAIAGLMTPDLLLRGIRKRYLASVEQAMPDALDLLVICAEAGLALEQGMERVAREIRVSSPACAVELSLTHNELRILADRRTALINMGRRTGLVSLQRLAGTLAQALQYGTPLSQALRSLAAELRTEALTRFEARAARLPVLMTLPMILFILPCVFLVVAGPAVLSVISVVSI